MSAPLSLVLSRPSALEVKSDRTHSSSTPHSSTKLIASPGILRRPILVCREWKCGGLQQRSLIASQQQLKRSLRFNRRRVEESLCHFAIEVLEFRDLLVGLRALGDYLQSEAMSQHDDQSHYLAVLMVRGHAGDENAVDFQGIDWETRKAAQG